MLAFVRRLFALAVLVLTASAAPALATETGSPGWLIHDQVLLDGPGVAYDVVGQLGGATRIRVDRCSGTWCRIHANGVGGWVSLYDVSFGRGPYGPLRGPRLGYPSGGLGVVCFYTGVNFTGDRICKPSGFVASDLQLAGFDNSFASVSVEGGVSVTACRDRHFKSYCERIVESQANLIGFLDDGVSSYRVW